MTQSENGDPVETTERNERDSVLGGSGQDRSGQGEPAQDEAMKDEAALGQSTHSAATQGDARSATSDVSARPADAIATAFGDREPLADQYHAWLAEHATVRGLIGPREVPRLWDRHILNCAALADVIPEGATVADIGSGAGLPGIPLAIARPDVTVVLIEPLLRRTTFLDEVVADLGLDNVRVIRGRAEEKVVRKEVGVVDVVTSRAVAPLGKLAGWSLPLVRTNGQMIAMKGSSAAEEIERDAKLIKKAKGRQPVIVEVGKDLLETPTYVVQIRKV